jgi:hypothetical protein
MSNEEKIATEVKQFALPVPRLQWNVPSLYPITMEHGS